MTEKILNDFWKGSEVNYHARPGHGNSFLIPTSTYIFQRLESRELYNLENSENLKYHRQLISVKLLEPTEEHPPRVAIQIKTSEIDHPISFRFSSPLDLEAFILAVVNSYKLLVERKISDPEIRFALYDHLYNEIIRKLKV